MASLLGGLAVFAGADGLEVSKRDPTPHAPAGAGETLEIFETSLAAARELLQGLDHARADAPWSPSRGTQVMFTMPRALVIRRLMLDHWIHHRGRCPSTCACWTFRCPPSTAPARTRTPSRPPA